MPGPTTERPDDLIQKPSTGSVNRLMRKLVATLVGVILLFPAVTSSTIHADDTPAQQAAKEIADARDRANAAADALFQAESALDVLEVDQQSLKDEIDALEAQIAKLRANVEAVAVNRFTRSGASALPLLTGFQSAGEQAQMDVLIDVVNETSADDFDQYDSLNKDLDKKKADLQQNEVDAETARDQLEQRRKDALAEVQTLKDVEAQRLQDEAVKKALEAEQAERRRQDDAKAKSDAEAQRSANDAGQATKSKESALPASGTASDDNDDPDASTGVKATGGSGGGQTGTIGVGGQPGSAPGDLGFDGWICPVQGAVGFGDTWGAPRSGGRTHLGVDMIGARGLPVVAVVDGFAQSKVNTLGGNTISLAGADGNKYYYAHLDGWATLGSVTAGTVIGYLGQTGNAIFSVPHLHFEIHPGGGAAVNPYPTVRAHC
ncbi:MAG: putative metalloendopeptidase [Ilumatobacteraceae bacterium]|nr:putative metalloendopeptidase [Ilumatobacteraceae bacterium]